MHPLREKFEKRKAELRLQQTPDCLRVWNNINRRLGQLYGLNEHTAVYADCGGKETITHVLFLRNLQRVADSLVRKEPCAKLRQTLENDSDWILSAFVSLYFSRIERNIGE